MAFLRSRRRDTCVLPQHLHLQLLNQGAWLPGNALLTFLRFLDFHYLSRNATWYYFHSINWHDSRKMHFKLSHSPSLSLSHLNSPSLSLSPASQHLQTPGLNRVQLGFEQLGFEQLGFKRPTHKFSVWSGLIGAFLGLILLGAFDSKTT